MVATEDERDGGAGGKDGRAMDESTQNTQYDGIGTRYLEIKTLPAAEPELPSILSALGDVVEGKKCLDLACGTGKYTHLISTLSATSVTGYDISPTMISGALTTYPPSQYPNLRFGVADCSVLDSLPASDNGTFDLVFSAWFLNYAGSERELISMFHVIESQMAPGGKFIGLTTDAHDPNMSIQKLDFYGLDILVLDAAYIAPDSGEVVGIKAKVKVSKAGFEFDCFQFRKEVYERCAKEAGLRIRWRESVMPDDERKETGYWEEWLARPTFAMLEATRTG
ncbi:S-adenosyl-L-methionine-dependent methyltransferase [Didymella exigua CBS 183.55]|uniref:S-adenosyl-L-methionine-dependent methyltransferase n=1 Tax=Didymella exigua CBS 183.55 TaxID=1150837 RepID=A0A6A5RVY5_9PLEO|nr:S-adenosyl-L-methionine-dependent methyltransferase [Didymella exigua CBS 183.55]KAF1930446.1 S-adenosyl-L-methionine-dependent methyltransferase [Didymella exigua CBS 183.55]